MIPLLNTLEATHLTHINGVSEFVHPYHPLGCKHYPIKSRSILIGGDKIHPLAVVHENKIQLGSKSFQLGGKKGVIQNPYIHYSLSDILGDFPGEVSLNHMGICINVDDIDEIVGKVIEGYKESMHRVFEDPTGKNDGMRWLFIGNNESHDPMFELVLPNPDLNMRDHFQIDIDTHLSQKEIEQYFRKKCGENFFDWKLDIPDIGTVLQMGTLQTCDDYDIRLGVGNNKRNRVTHRETLNY